MNHRLRLRQDALRAGLTDREIAVLVEYGDGHTTAGVAHRLGISDATVRRSLARARRRLDVDSNAALIVAVAYRRAA